MSEAKVGEFVTLQRGQSYKGSLLGKPGPVLLGLGTIQRNGGFRDDNLKTYGGDSPDKILVGPGDLYVSLKDVTHAADLLGAVARVPDSVRLGRLTQDTVRLEVDSTRIDPDYLYWLLRSPQFRAYCRTRGTGTTNLDLSREEFLSYRFVLPPRREQISIVEVLGALDDKIAANTRLAEIADNLVRAEYAGLAEYASEARKIGSIATHPRDLVDPSQMDGNLIYVGLEHVPRRRMWLSESGRSGDVTSTKASFARGDVLFGKLRPYFHKVVSAPNEGICSTDILVLRAKDADLTGFLLAAAASDITVERCTAASEGTRMPRTSWKDLAAVEVPWPGESAAQAFSARASAVRDRVESALMENRTLGRVRDALLPQLMSGKLRVRDTERVLEGVV